MLTRKQKKKKEKVTDTRQYMIISGNRDRTTVILFSSGFGCRCQKAQHNIRDSVVDTRSFYNTYAGAKGCRAVAAAAAASCPGFLANARAAALVGKAVLVVATLPRCIATPRNAAAVNIVSRAQKIRAYDKLKILAYLNRPLSAAAGELV